MAETCIVCLGDLQAGSELPDLAVSVKQESDDSNGETKDAPLGDSDPAASEMVAHLLPCGHNLHNECLKPWVERANSCPICRQNFNLVELSDKIGAPVISSYAVEDKTQVADVDPYLVVDDEIDEVESEPCPICGLDDNEDVLLLCDGCDAAYHTYCVDLDRVPPGHWFCEACATHRALDPTNIPSISQVPHHPPGRRTRAQQRQQRSRSRPRYSNWDRVWQSIWDRLNLDLDDPFDDNLSSSQIRRSRRTQDRERREFREWQRRLAIAERQGAASRFRDTAATLLERRQRPPVPRTESREEVQAWQAFEKAREIQGESSRRRKRSSKTSSPAEPETPQPERKLKRPRTRRGEDVASSSSSNPSTSTATTSATIENGIGPNRVPNGATDGPSFLQSLLREVESSAPSEDDNSRVSAMAGVAPFDQLSPRALSSPGASPAASNHPTPRALSATPPPYSPRPTSPAPLTSRIEPVYIQLEPPVPLQVARPNGENESRLSATVSRQPRPITSSNQTSSASDGSPTRANMPLSAKSDIQKMVKTALDPYYEKHAVSKEQYTDINRTISRMLYDKVADVTTLDQKARDKWEKFANDEVSKAIKTLNEPINQEVSLPDS